MFDTKNRFLVLTISAALLSVVLDYVIHVEYFRIYSVIFFLVHTSAIILSPNRVSEKAKEASVVLVFACVMFASAVVLGR